jgi:hypothetical protein
MFSACLSTSDFFSCTSPAWTGSTRRRPPSEAPAKPLRCFAPATASLSEFSGWHPGIRDQFKLGRWTTFSYWPVSSWDCLLSSKTWDSMIMVMHSLVRHPWKWGDFIPTSTRSHQFHGWNITRSPATSFGSAIFDLLKSPDQLLSRCLPYTRLLDVLQTCLF